MENGGAGHTDSVGHAPWEVNAFLMLPSLDAGIIHTAAGGLQQLNAFLIPACPTTSAVCHCFNTPLDAPVHLNAMKCKGSAPWELTHTGWSTDHHRSWTKLVPPFSTKSHPVSHYIWSHPFGNKAVEVGRWQLITSSQRARHHYQQLHYPDQQNLRSYR